MFFNKKNTAIIVVIMLLAAFFNFHCFDTGSKGSEKFGGNNLYSMTSSQDLSRSIEDENFAYESQSGSYRYNKVMSAGYGKYIASNIYTDTAVYRMKHSSAISELFRLNNDSESVVFYNHKKDGKKRGDIPLLV